MLRQQSYAILSESRKKDVCDEFCVVLDVILLHFECTSCVQFMKKNPFHSLFCPFNIFSFVIVFSFSGPHQTGASDHTGSLPATFFSLL